MTDREYTGKEWDDLLRCFSVRDLKASIKGAYRKTGNKILLIARGKLMSSGMAHASKLRKDIRLRVYPRGGGFMITVKPHGKHGFTKNRKGFEKPIAMWASEGTGTRLPRKGPHYADIGGGRVRKIDYMGRMPSYGFLKDVESQGGAIVEKELGQTLDAAVMSALSKSGWK